MGVGRCDVSTGFRFGRLHLRRTALHTPFIAYHVSHKIFHCSSLPSASIFRLELFRTLNFDFRSARDYLRTVCTSMEVLQHVLFILHVDFVTFNSFHHQSVCKLPNLKFTTTHTSYAHTAIHGSTQSYRTLLSSICVPTSRIFQQVTIRHPTHDVQHVI